MTLTVPAPVAAYLAAEQAKDSEQLSLCFTVDGLVRVKAATIAAATPS